MINEHFYPTLEIIEEKLKSFGPHMTLYNIALALSKSIKIMHGKHVYLSGKTDK